MSTGRPGPGEELNSGPETVPRLAATVILLRGGADAVEVLLVQRNPQSRFMAGAWVSPAARWIAPRAQETKHFAQRPCASSPRKQEFGSPAPTSWWRSHAGSRRPR